MILKYQALNTSDVEGIIYGMYLQILFLCENLTFLLKLAVSFEVRSGENVPGIPGACATRDFAYLVRCLCCDLLSWKPRSIMLVHSNKGVRYAAR